MEDFIAHNSRWRLFFIILGAVVFVALGMWMVGMFGEVPSSSRYPAGFVMFMGWICIGFFGLCALAGVKKFFDGEAQLHIGPSGIRWSSWSNQLIPWLEIRDITTWSYRGQKSIILHLKNPRDFPASGLARMFAGINQRLAGGDISIPLTGTNCNYDEAMSAIEHFRSVAADADPQTGMTL